MSYGKRKKEDFLNMHSQIPGRELSECGCQRIVNIYYTTVHYTFTNIIIGVHFCCHATFFIFSIFIRKSQSDGSGIHSRLTLSFSSTLHHPNYDVISLCCCYFFKRNTKIIPHV